MQFEHFKFLVEHMFEAGENGQIRQKYDAIDVEAMHPLVLAYIGDAYFTLYVRGRLLSYEQSKVRILNVFGAQMVSAAWQSAAYQALESCLTNEERDVFRRGRNAKSHAPRSATVAQYRASTGFETLLGTLYLKGNFRRLEELAGKAFAVITQKMRQEIAVKKNR